MSEIILSMYIFQKLDMTSQASAIQSASPSLAASISVQGTRVDVSQDANLELHVKCSNPRCDGQGFVDRTEDLFRCPLCKRFNCLVCEVIHESLTCAEYKLKKKEPTVPLTELANEVVEEQDDLENQELEEPDAGAEGRIVDCKAEGCNGYGYVEKSATVSQCFACNHWTCVRCKACHESMSCEEYKHGGHNSDDEVLEAQPRDSIAGPSKETCQDVGQSHDKSGGVLQRFKEMLLGGAGQDKPPTNLNVDSDVPSEGHANRRLGALKPNASVARKATNPQKAENRGICGACRRNLYDAILPDCEHEVCKSCITTAVQSTVTFKVTCPVQQETVKRCQGSLPEDVIKNNVLKKVYKLWKTKEAWDRISCQTCKTELLKDRKKKTLVCPRCHTSTCLECCAVHEGMTCSDYIMKTVNDLDRGVYENPEDKKRRFKEQLDLYQQDVIQAFEDFDCAICFTTVKPEEGLVLKNCLHQICKDCLVNTARNSPSALAKCPHDPCEMEISDTELRACLSPEHYEELQERGLREAERTSAGSFHCKTADCKGWCFYEEESNVFKCPVCSRTNCLRCEAIHENMNCAEYQEDLKRRAANDAAAGASMNMLEAELAKGEAMRCSKCRVILIKRGGCDAIQCACCNTLLCWATKGPRWGPKGQGDTSGGCRCGVNGVKCHPTCVYCH